MLYDIYDEQIDVTSKAFLGLTVACARCHDHKFDPISTQGLLFAGFDLRQHGSFQGLERTSPKLLLTRRSFRRSRVSSAYQAHQESRSSAKQKEIDDIVDDRESSALPARLQPRLADYMVAARRCTRTGRSAQMWLAKQDWPEDC